MIINVSNKLLYFIVFFAMFPFIANSQQDPYFSSYSFNPLLINTSLASLEKKNYATVIYRNQWTGYSSGSKSLGYDRGGSPISKLLTVSLKNRNKKLSFGINMSDDQLRPKSSFNISPFIAFKKKINSSLLSIGISPSIGSQTLHFDQFVFVDKTDPFNEVQGKQTEWQPDLDLGFSYSGDKLLLSLSINHLFIPSFNFNVESLINRADITYNVLAKYLIEIDRDLFIEPYILFRSDLTSYTFDLSALASYKERIKIGTSYRYNEAVILFLGYSLLKENQLHLGYAFDYVISNVKAKHLTSNELLIRYDLPMPQIKKPIRTPRFIY